MRIDGVFEIINNTSETFWTGGNIIAIIVAVISIIGSIIVVIISNDSTKKINNANIKIQKKINDDNTKLQEQWHTENLQIQEKLNQANIDANLIANARIEWIQKVRNLTAELISIYFSILNSKDTDKIQVAFNQSIEKTELLVLYFGHEDDEVKSEDLNILFNKENNIGKNELIVDFVISLSQKFNNYNTFIQTGGLDTLEKSIREAQQEMYRNAENVKVGEYWHEEAGEMMDVEETHYQTHDFTYVSNLQAKKENKVIEITNLQNDLISIRNIIRTYLKIEWNKAKSAK